VSAIINVDQEVGEPWPLDVFGHSGKLTKVGNLTLNVLSMYGPEIQSLKAGGGELTRESKQDLRAPCTREHREPRPCSLGELSAMQHEPLQVLRAYGSTALTVLLCGGLQVLMKPGDMVLVSTPAPELPPCITSIIAAGRARLWQLTPYHSIVAEHAADAPRSIPPCSMRARPVPTADPTRLLGASWRMCSCSEHPASHDTCPSTIFASEASSLR
jgi:hypothetical protein